jgi:hypothetical protein
MTDQHQQGCDSVVAQAFLQVTEIEILAPMQLIVLEQVGNDHHIEWALVKRGRSRRNQRARQRAYCADHGSWEVGKSTTRTPGEQRRILPEGARVFVQEMK